MSVEEHLPPNFGRLDKALRSIGYSFEAAVADIIDNSIDATARNVLVRFILRKNKALDLVILDDGDGMSPSTLKEAMRFGADVTQELDRLGKFGLGLKLASLSQAKELRVFSHNNSKTSGRGWLEEGISSGFMSTILGPAECREMLKLLVPDRPWKKSGTVVWWSYLYRVGQNYSDPNEHTQKLMRRLKDYLSIAFHRFLAGKPRLVRMEIDIFDGDSSLEGLPLPLEPLNPFGYDATGRKGFPAELVAADGYENRIKIFGHIWPPNSETPEYALPGGANSRQGFYFYRNNRLIQGGGWNGMREAEPHRSLARVEIDMHPDFDVDVSLDVKKVEIQLPPDLVKAIQRSKTDSGVRDYYWRTYTKYLRILANHQPPVFVMENVKGLLSVKVKEKHVFKRILSDLKSPTKALPRIRAAKPVQYNLYPLSADRTDLPRGYKPEDFVLRAEKHGIPQTRHRIIILGVRSDIRRKPGVLAKRNPATVKQVIQDLPKLRSGLSKEPDSARAWRDAVHKLVNAKIFQEDEVSDELCEALVRASKHVGMSLSRGDRFIERSTKPERHIKWYVDTKLRGICNHETRSHIRADLHRYFFAAVFARKHRRSPLLEDFPKALLPKHKNVKEALQENKFNDRFRVQLAGQASTTVVSHIAKDGHYYIHYDSAQCRSL
ncbi:MAG: ATP-binding protein, partial [Limisphaerales bacterium]